MDSLTPTQPATRWAETARAIYNDAGPLQWAVAKRAAPGEQVSGDEFLVQPFPGGALVAVVDGLGHGEAARLAARLAISTLTAHAQQSLPALVERCHQALKTTRGAVMTLGSFREEEGSLNWIGVGNVEGLLIRSAPNQRPARESVLLRGGVVGYQLPFLTASLVKIQAGDLLILATDGIGYGYSDKVMIQDPPQRIADAILGNYSKGSDDALVLVLRYVGTHHK